MRAEPDQLERLGDTLVALGRGQARDAQRQLDVLGSRKHGDESDRLEDESDVVAAHRGERVLGEPAEDMLTDRDLARGGSVEPAQQVQQRRLSGARGPAHDQQLTRVHAQVDARDGVHLPARGRKRAHHVSRPQHRFTPSR